MFEKSLGKVTVNGISVPIYYKNGKFYVSFRKLRNSVRDTEEKNCDRVLKRIDLLENEDFMVDNIVGFTKKYYFITENGMIRYLNSLTNLSDVEVENVIHLIRNNIIKYKNMIEPNRDYVNESNSEVDNGSGDITDINRSNSFDTLEEQDNIIDDSKEYDSYVAALLTNIVINQDNIMQRLNVIEEKIDYINDEIEEIKCIKPQSSMANSNDNLDQKILFDTIAVMSSGLSSLFKRNHLASCQTAALKQASLCKTIGDKYYDKLSNDEKANNVKVKLIG